MTVPSFPNGPTNGQTYTENGVTYTWVENGAETGYWAASGDSITLQSVTDSGNTTTNDVTTSDLTAGNVTAGDVTTNGFVSITGNSGYLNVNRTNPAAGTTSVAVFQADGTTGALIRANGSANFTGAVTCGVATTNASADETLATKGWVDDAVAGGVAGAGVPAGSITMFGGNTAPTGWLICDGTAVSRTANADLFTAIGTTFGNGDGSTTFNLPDIRGLWPVMPRSGSNIWPTTIGQELQGTYVQTAGGTYKLLQVGNGFAQNPGGQQVGSTGGGSGSYARTNYYVRPPSIGLNFIIRT